MGLWSVEEGDDKALERLGGNCAATVCLTLAQALSEIRKFAEVWEAPEPEPGQHSISA
jgi:hypothetical protein